jgi:hypothetical protein
MKQNVVIILCALGAVIGVAEMDSVRIDSQLVSVSSGKWSERIVT